MADYLRRLRIGDNVVFVRWVFLITVDGKAADVFALFPLQVEHHADVFGQILQIPLVHQTVDLPGFLVALDLCVGVIGHGDEADTPDGEQTVDVLLYQFHVPGEAGLALAQDDLEFLRFGGFNHAVEVGALAVHAGIVLITKQAINIPPVVNGVAGQQRLLILGSLVVWERVMTEISRYWRRRPLGNDDFGDYFLKNLFFTEAFRIDLLYWLLLNLLTTAAMAGIVWLLLSGLEGSLDLRASLSPAWSRDGGTLLEIAERRWSVARSRWQQRLQKRRWLFGLAAAGLFLTVWTVAVSWQRPPVHSPIAIGHRGSAGAVENTLPAILDAQARGMDFAEIDVQLTLDGVPVLFHDGDLRRLAGRSGSVGELDLASLREIPLSDHAHPDANARIASLEEVLQALEGGAMGLLVELKPESGNGAALAAAVMELIERYGFGERSMFMSLDYTCLMPLMEKHPEWWTGFCLFGTSGDIDENIWRYDVDFLAVEEALVSGRLVLQAREQSLPVYVWSVYDDERMRQYLEMGVSGIITDYPEDLRAVLDAYNALHPTGVIQEGKWFPIQEDGEIPVS